MKIDKQTLILRLLIVNIALMVFSLFGQIADSIDTNSSQGSIYRQVEYHGLLNQQYWEMDRGETESAKMTYNRIQILLGNEPRD
tara:strand:+ start:109 stop:360 length:252 start_codon:yes stop_codon:yes gene_type:complete